MVAPDDVWREIEKKYPGIKIFKVGVYHNGESERAEVFVDRNILEDIVIGNVNILIKKEKLVRLKKKFKHQKKKKFINYNISTFHQRKTLTPEEEIKILSKIPSQPQVTPPKSLKEAIEINPNNEVKTSKKVKPVNINESVDKCNHIFTRDINTHSNRFNLELIHLKKCRLCGKGIRE